MKKKIHFKPMSIMGNLIVYAYALLLIVPFYFVIITAFKDEAERIINPVGLPEVWKISNFAEAWTRGGLTLALKNSVIVTFGAVAFLLLNVIIVSYCLNKIRDTKVGVFLYMLVLSAMFIPQVGGATALVMRRTMGLYNNLWGEIFCAGFGITTGVFLCSGFLRTIPRDLEEAAMIDGANDIQTCFKVIVPVILPSLVTVGILSFTGTWNNALGMMLTLRDQNLWTIPIALYLRFTNEHSVEYTSMFAGVLITAIPIIIVYCKCQKYFVSALAGSVKG